MLKKILSSNKYLLSVSLLLAIVSLPIILRASPHNKEISKISNIISLVSHCNNSLSESIHDSTIDTKNSKEKLTNGLLELNNLKSSLTNLNVSNSNVDIKDASIKTISNTIILYQLSIDLISTEDFNTLNDTHIKYLNQLELVSENYNNLKLLGVDSTFDDSQKVFFKNSSNYATTVLKISRDKDTNASNNKSYLNSIKECYTLLSDISEDLTPALNQIRLDNRNLDILIEDVRNKGRKLTLIKNKSYSISIPEGGDELYNSLKNSISTCEVYLNSFQYSLKVETSSKSSQNIDINYAESTSKYQDFLGDLKVLNENMDKFNKIWIYFWFLAILFLSGLQPRRLIYEKIYNYIFTLYNPFICIFT